MKLLICTQVVDINHPILGFFHRWLEEFAQHCEEVNVICLEEGEHHLPENVHVHSLGKEEGRSRLKYVYRLYKYSWQLRKKYTHVFVHMNEEFAILGSPFWRVLGKRVGHWRMHGKVDWRLRLSEKLVHLIFTGSKESFRLQSTKLNIVGHGIDMVRFAKQNAPKDIDLLTVGRMSPSKNLEALVDVLALVREKHDVSLTIIGKPITNDDEVYLERVQQYIKEKGLVGHVHFPGAIQNAELPQMLNRAKVFVHAATNGSLDKALLEPLAVEVPLIAMSEGADSLPLKSWRVHDLTSFADRVAEVLESDHSDRSHELRDFVLEHHSLSALIPRVLQLLEH